MPKIQISGTSHGKGKDGPKKPKKTGEKAGENPEGKSEEKEPESK